MKKRLLVLFAMLLLVPMNRGVVGGWPWNTDLVEQPSIQPQEGPLKNPVEGTLPQQGGSLVSNRQEAENELTNPVEVNEKSLAVGRELYHIFCVLCHGDQAKGGGPISRKFIPPPDLTSDFFKKRADGHIYGTIRFGGAVMPAYGETMSSEEIWAVVNYLRSLQESQESQ